MRRFAALMTVLAMVVIGLVNLPVTAANATPVSNPSVTVTSTCTSMGVQVSGLPDAVPAKDAVPGTPGQPYIAPTEGTPAVPAVPTTFIQEWEFVQKTTGKVKWMPYDWNGAEHPGDNSGNGEDASGGNGEGWSRTGQHKDTDTVLKQGTDAIPAVPGTPGQPYIAPTEGTPAVPAKVNTIKVTIEGAVVEDKAIDSSFEKSYALPDQNGSHAYSVTVTPWNGAPIIKTGTTKACAAPPAVEVCNGPGALNWTKNAVLTTATVTLKAGFISCDVALNGFGTEGPTWPTSGTQWFVDQDKAHLTQQNPTATLTIENDSCYGQNDLFIGTKKFDGIDGALPHYPDSTTPTGLLASWNGKLGVNCAPTPVITVVTPVMPVVKKAEQCGVGGSVTPVETVGVKYVVDFDQKSGDYTVTATPLNDSYKFAGEQTVVFSGNAGPLVKCPPPTVITEQPLEPVFHDSCGVTDDSTDLPADTDTYSYQKKVVNGVTTVTLVSTAGVVFGEDVRTTWSYTFTDMPCPVTVVTPPSQQQTGTTPGVTKIAQTSAETPLRPVTVLAHTGSYVNFWLAMGAGLMVLLSAMTLVWLRRRAHTE